MSRVHTVEYLESKGFKMSASRGSKQCPWAKYEEDERDHWVISISFEGKETEFDYFPLKAVFPNLGNAFLMWILSAGFGSYDFEGWLEVTEKDSSVADDPREIEAWKRSKENYEKAHELIGEEKLIQLFQYYAYVS